MWILIISYGTQSPSACLIKEDGIIGPKLETEYCQIENCSRVFPENAIAGLLHEQDLEVDDIDYVVLCGKPFSYFERLINTHIFFFPYSFLRFFSDFRDFFINKIRIKNLLKKRLGFSRKICYPEPMDAIADGLDGDFISEVEFIIISLSNTIGLRTMGFYKRENSNLELIKSLTYPNCLSILYNLNSQFIEKRLVNLSDLIKVYRDGSFVLKNKFLQSRNAVIALKQGYAIPNQTDILKSLEEILERLIMSVITSLDDKVLFVSDYSLHKESCERLQRKFKDLTFKYFDSSEIMKYVAKYVKKAISDGGKEILDK